MKPVIAMRKGGERLMKELIGPMTRVMYAMKEAARDEGRGAGGGRPDRRIDALASCIRRLCRPIHEILRTDRVVGKCAKQLAIRGDQGHRQFLGQRDVLAVVCGAGGIGD